MVKLDLPEKKIEAKMELSAIVSELMPGGKPKYLEVVKYPKISDLMQEHGRGKMHRVLYFMVKDFCSSINVVRNMNEDQIVETAAILLDECDNFRLEDYTMMFSMVKRGQLFKIFDHLDIQVVSQILDAYWKERKLAAIEKEQAETLEDLGPSIRKLDDIHPQDAKLMRAADGLAGAIGDLKTKFSEWRDGE